ncbi:MAG: CpaF family protein [Actinomycetes bacterium]
MSTDTAATEPGLADAWPSAGPASIPEVASPVGPESGWAGDDPDWALVRELREAVSRELGEQLRARPGLSADSQRELARSLIAQRVAAWSDRQATSNGHTSPGLAQEAQLADAVLAAIFGLGRIQPLVDDPAIENVDISGCDRVWIEYADGRIEPGAPVADSDTALVDVLQSFATYLGQTTRSFSTAHPTLRLKLPDGSRLTAIMAVTPRPEVHIRRHRLLDVTLDRLVALGTLDPVLLEFLRAAMRARRNIVVTGTVNVGKTTLVRALAGEIDPLERVATIEKEYELLLHELPERHARVVAMEAREGNAEASLSDTANAGAGEVSLAVLLETALRMNPRRIIVGEVLGDEIVPMLRALASGTSGSLCTIHARTARGVFDRIAELGLCAPQRIPIDAAHLLAVNGIDLVVHVDMLDERARGGALRRYVSTVLEVAGIGENGRPATNELFTPGPDGRAVPAGTPPSPRLLDQLVRAGFDPTVLDHPSGLWPTSAAPPSTRAGRR